MHYLMTVLVVIASLLSSGTACADIGDQLFKLLANDGEAFDLFGCSVGIDNGIVVVGARLDDDNGAASGSAYLFDSSGGVQITKLLPNNGAAGDNFANSIAIDNGIVAVGAFRAAVNGLGSGSAYLFNASTSEQIAKLVPIDGMAGDVFGNCIAINKGIVAVGAYLDDAIGTNSGSAYLFNVSNGDQLFKLLPSDGAEIDRFGYSIAIDNGIVAVGAIADDDNGDNSGSAYLFDAFTGTQIAKLLPKDGAANDLFGFSIAINNGIVAVGASRDDDNGSNSGSAYLFDASTGSQIAKLLPSDGAANDNFGISIAIDNGVVVVGAYNDDDNGSNSGSAYLFNASSGAQIVKLLPKDGAAHDHFGFSTAIDNGVVAVGASRDDDNGAWSGSAYLFDAAVAPGKCPWDLNRSGTVDTNDLLELFAQWGTAGPADFDARGAVGTSDLLILFTNWGPCR